MKKVTMKDINLEVFTGSSIYVAVDVLRFVKDEESPFVEVEIENNGQYEYLDEFESEEVIIEHDELKRAALNWIFKNVELKENIAALEVQAQEQPVKNITLIIKNESAKNAADIHAEIRAAQRELFCQL